MTLELITPNWSAPKNIKSFSTTRKAGFSHGIYQGLNLAQHVNDDKCLVQKNRQFLQQQTSHPDALWLEQIHSTKVLPFDVNHEDKPADASFTDKSNQTCLIMTADCLPILFCNQQGNWVAAAHAGWRGLADGILQNTVEKYVGKHVKNSQLMAWIGPAISQQYFEVGEDVYRIFTSQNRENCKCFQEKPSVGEQKKWWCDLASIAESLLKSLSVDVYKSNLCTFADSERFYSYRRDGQTGRMASAIWIE